MAHRTVKGAAEVEQVLRNSRFIGYARPLSSEAEVDEFLVSIRSLHPDASHHCWAFRLGSHMRSGDDGEPGGTAGRPILEVVLKRDLDRLAIVVVRYFGGTRLGAGGLVRAYSGTAAKVLDAAGERVVEDKCRLEVHVPFPYVDVLHRLLANTRGARTSEDGFDAQGWRLTVELPASEAKAFRQRLTEATRGAASIEG